MSLVSTAAVVAQEAAVHEGGVPTFVFGLFAFGALVVALIVVTMINVNR